MQLKKIKKYFNNYELWKTSLLISIYLDMMFTIIGVGRYGIAIEGNDLIVKMVTNNIWIGPFIFISLVMLIFKITSHIWHKNYKGRKYWHDVAFRSILWLGLVIHSYLTWIRWSVWLMFNGG